MTDLLLEDNLAFFCLANYVWEVIRWYRGKIRYFNYIFLMLRIFYWSMLYWSLSL